MQIGNKLIPPVTAQATATTQEKAVAHTAATVGNNLIDEIVKKLGGVEAIDTAITTSVKIAELEAQVKKLKKLVDPVLKNLAGLANEHKLGDGTQINGLAGSLVVSVSSRSTRKIVDKLALYNKLEAIKKGLYFELSDVSLGDVDAHIVEAERVGAGIQHGTNTTYSVVARKKQAEGA